MAGYKIISLFILGVVFTSFAQAEGNICEAEGVDPDGGLLPHETDCSLFYKCEWGTPVVLSCPPGLEFNPELKWCDWPEEAKCSHHKDDATFDNNSHKNVEDCNDDDAPHTPCPPVSEPECPPHIVSKPAVHLPHPTDCRKYYQCDWGVPYVRDCPCGLHFRADLQVCDWANRARCACF